MFLKLIFSIIQSNIIKVFNMSLSILKILFVDVDDLNTIDNIGHGMCLAFAFFQGYNLGKGFGRCVEADLRHQISQAMVDIIRFINIHHDKEYHLTPNSKNIVMEWAEKNSPDKIIEEASSLPSDQY